ncbi:MAG: HAMP domain-containing histidine kinase [Deltaproteobacteria bacterium]|nr:HAMP domain-containing histidine kinase [Deltaproteobacteria bacterium]
MRLPRWSRTLRGRVLGAVLIGVAFQLAALAYDVHQLDRIGRSVATVNDTWLPLARLGARMEGVADRGDPARIGGLVDQAKAAVATGEGRAVDDEEAAHLRSARAQLDEIVQSTADSARLRDEVRQVSALAEARVAALSAQTALAQKDALAVSLGLVAASLPLGLALFWLAGTALRPVVALTEQARRLQAGERPAAVDAGHDDEIGVLASAFNEMAEAVDERNRIRDRLAQSERLALVGQLLAQVTHEVRNPLNAMSLHAELLADEVSPEGRPMLGTLVNEIRRLEAVTERYLDLARRRTPVLAPEDPVEIARSVVALEDERLRRLGVETTVENGASRVVDIDGNLLRRALLNLVRNAAEAGAKRVAVRVDVDEALRVTVIDDGPGMTPEVASRIFEPFFSTKGRGTGLGLALTRQGIEDLGGTIVVYSEPGKGATFVVTVPV